MYSKVKKIGKYFGVDKAIFFTSSSSILSALGSVVSVILVVKYMSITEQGFYYTFGSIVAIQLFFELGLSGIITQYVAHESANLTWLNRIELTGSDIHKSRMSSLLHFSIKWYFIFSILLLLILILLGFLFFNKYYISYNSIEWKFPWIFLSIGTSLNLLISPIVAFMQGLGKVKEVANLQFFAQLVKILFLTIGLIFNLKLYVLGIVSVVNFIIILTILYIKYYKLLINIWKVNVTEKINYYKEIFPYQWKIAVSWISGYFIFQLFNPVLFATEGPEVAGQMGMTMAALNGILSLSFAWMTTKVPLFSTLIAKKEFEELDSKFNLSLKQSLIINIFALLSLYSIIFLLRHYQITIGSKNLGSRFLGYLPLTFMMIPIVLNHIVASWATYLRCHKKEPFLINSLVGGVLCALSTIILGKYYGVIGITSGYLLINILMFPWSMHVYTSRKKKWHNSINHN